MKHNWRIALLLVGILALASLPLSAWSYLNFEQISVAATAIGLTNSVVVGGTSHPAATRASCRVRTAELSFTYNGTTPTSTVGTLAEVGDVITLTGTDVLLNFLAIRTTSTSAQLDCHVSTP